MAKETSRSSEMVNISAQIPAEIAEILGKVSKAEERSKSYYIRKGLELFLMPLINSEVQHLQQKVVLPV